MLDVTSMNTIAQLRHPAYSMTNQEWQKWRLTMAGGRLFINAYLRQYSTREDSDDFLLRSSLTYCAAYAKSSIKEIINAVYQRMRDITRVGGPDSYVNAVAGRQGGVNLEGMSMNMFMGQKILPELLSMGQVGMYVDMPEITQTQTLADTYGVRPYIYYYAVEDILNWVYTDMELRSILLRDTIYSYDDETGMPDGTTQRYRYVWKNQQNEIYVRTWEGDRADETLREYRLLGLKRIPFHIIDIGESLLTDIADHQIALTNIESSDIGYILQSNFPMFTEQSNSKISPTNTKKPGETPGETPTGPTVGRTYPLGAERPGWIAPPADPLRVSMEKQKALKEEIRHLVHLAVSNLSVSRESADSKHVDNQGLEAGLAFIGLTLEHAENFIAERWCEYVGEETLIPNVKYPSQYSLKSDTERRADAKAILEIKEQVPSTLGRKELIKLAARTLFDGRVQPDIMDSILDQIDAASFISGIPADIDLDVKNGLVTRDIASQARGYPAGQAAKANAEYIERLRLIQETQTIGVNGGAGQNPASDGKTGPTDPNQPDGTTGKLKNPAARGVPDLSPNPDANAQQEKAPLTQP